jgi:hypothetical protein
MSLWRRREFRLLVCIAIALACVPCGGDGSPSEPKPIAVQNPPAALKLDAFYAKYVDAGGIPVVSSARVPDAALIAAADVLGHLLANRPDLRKALAEAKVKLAVMSKVEVTTDVPEHARLKPKDYWDRRARGLGGTRRIPTTSCAEENVLGYDDDRYSGESILIHEFAHTIHEVGLAAVDKDFDTRLRKLFEAARDKGLWKDTYAATNRNEYWAEGVQCWFDCNAKSDPPNGVHNHVRTREQLEQYDPALAALIAETFGKTDWRWTPNGAHKPKW